MKKIKIEFLDEPTTKYFANRNKEKKDNLKTSIVNVQLPNQYKIYLFEGNKHPHKDFIVTYSIGEKHPKPITPSHTHWVVDLLLKMQKKESLTKQFINELIEVREKCQPAENNKKETLISITEKCTTLIDVSHYEDLNDIGLYDITFLSILLPLLIIQEKTNYGEDAKMLKNIFNELSKDKEELDIYRIINASKYRGSGN